MHRILPQSKQFVKYFHNDIKINLELKQGYLGAKCSKNGVKLGILRLFLFHFRKFLGHF